MLDARSRDSLSLHQGVAEIGEILAAALMRLQARKSSLKSADFGESSVDFSGPQSGHADPNSQETRR
jgi:hypothetical protein